ncbi:MAG TPA: magnesium chelatase ATPase subunit I [Xanthomonadales bacterium]|nr:magnesium chelatase ATPase subunit I [Xanthomonadales bacterium]
MNPAFPFSAIVGQDEMKMALLIAAVDPTIGGVLVFGDRGTGKSTAVRGLAGLLPKVDMVTGCPYNREPDNLSCECSACQPTDDGAVRKTGMQTVPVVDLPLGVTEDRVVGALDIERALVHGEKAFEPGLLARANRGFLYIDEVNLLEDHIVDLLLDVAASGENVVEREGLSVRHPARFVLVGSGNPEEGELRPQLLDRFGICVDVRTPTEISERIKVIRRRDEFERDPRAYIRRWAGQDGRIRNQILRARNAIGKVKVSEPIVETAAQICIALGTDGLRGELTLVRASRAMASLEGKSAVSKTHLRHVASMVLRHRLRRDPLDESDAGVRVERTLSEIFE